MNQHLVSRVLLNRWSNGKNGPIGVLNLNTLIEDTKSRIAKAESDRVAAEANVIFMPVGPRQVVALSKENRQREVSEAGVVALNKLQVRAACKEIYFRSRSDLGQVLSKALRDSQGQGGNGCVSSGQVGASE